MTTINMNAEEVDCVEALCRLSEASQTNGNPSFSQSSCTGGKMFGSPDCSDNNSSSSADKSKSGGGVGGFTCCVPGCFHNNNKNPELSFHAFPNGKSQEAKELRKKWIHLVSRKDFSPTTGHRVCSEHFPGGRKTYMNRLPTIVPKTIKPTPTKPRPTTKARNRAAVTSTMDRVKRIRY